VGLFRFYYDELLPGRLFVDYSLCFPGIKNITNYFIGFIVTQMNIVLVTEEYFCIYIA